jgi:hypothetical protein
MRLTAYACQGVYGSANRPLSHRVPRRAVQRYASCQRRARALSFVRLVRLVAACCSRATTSCTTSNRTCRRLACAGRGLVLHPPTPLSASRSDARGCKPAVRPQACTHHGRYQHVIAARTGANRQPKDIGMRVLFCREYSGLDHGPQCARMIRVAPPPAHVARRSVLGPSVVGAYLCTSEHHDEVVLRRRSTRPSADDRVTLGRIVQSRPGVVRGRFVKAELRRSTRTVMQSAKRPHQQTLEGPDLLGRGDRI